jgi:plastocyanin
VTAFRWLRRASLAMCALVVLTAETGRSARVTGQLSMLERGSTVNHDLATTVLYLEALDVRAEDDRGTVSTEAAIAMRGREFRPRSAVIRSGGNVKFPNEDPFSHNVFSNTEPGGFDLGLYRRGATRTATFAQPGVYPIYCNIHARMVSYVIAVPGRHVTLADGDGRFAFDDVPVGTYRLHVWHERAAHAVEDFVVTGTGASLRITLDARGFVAGAHLNKFGMPYSTTRTDRY